MSRFTRARRRAHLTVVPGTSTPFSRPDRPLTPSADQPIFSRAHWQTGITAPALKNALKYRREPATHKYGVSVEELTAQILNDTGRGSVSIRDQLNRFWYPDIHNLKVLPEAVAHEIIDRFEADPSIELIEQALAEHRAANSESKRALKHKQKQTAQDNLVAQDATHDALRTTPAAGQLSELIADQAGAPAADPPVQKLRLVSSTDAPVAPPDRKDPVTLVTEAHLLQAVASVDDKPATPKKRGPKPDRGYSVLALLVGLGLAMQYSAVVSKKTIAECLAYRLPPSARERLRLPEFAWHDAEVDPFTDRVLCKSYLNRHYRQVCRYFQQMREALNPCLVDVGHHMDKQAIETALAARTEEQLVREMRSRARLQAIGDHILAGSQPTEEQLIAWGYNLAVDETALQSAAAFSKQDSSHTTSDPFFSNSYKNPREVMGYGLTVAVLAPGPKGQQIPIIARGMRVGKSLGSNMKALQAVVDKHLNSHPGTRDGKAATRPELYVDPGYGGSGPADHLAVQALGVSMQWDLYDYQYNAPRRIAVGRDGDQPLGVVFGLGAFFTDAFTQAELKIFDRFRPLPIDADDATVAQWDADREFLELRRMRITEIKTVADHDAVTRVRVRMSGPCRGSDANGLQARVACDRLPASLEANAKRMLPLPTLRPKSLPEGQLPKCCDQVTVSLYLDEHPEIQRAFLSGEVAGFAEREDNLDTARAYSEGLFGATKNRYAGALAKYHTMRGEVEFTLMCALGLAIHNRRALAREEIVADHVGDDPAFIPKIRSIAEKIRARLADLAS
jgi:hypothetical protein